MRDVVLGGTGNDAPNSIAIGRGGNVVVGGFFSGTVDFGGGTITSHGGYDGIIAVRDSELNFVGAIGFGGSGYDQVDALAVDSTGRIIATGYSGSMSVDFGGGAHTLTGTETGFALSVSTILDYGWDTEFGGDLNATSIAVGPDGDVVIGGQAYGSNALGGGVTTDSGSDGFVIDLDTSGHNVWTKALLGGNSAVNGLAVDRWNEVIAVGFANGTIDFGAGAVTASGAYAWKLSPTGTALLAHSFASTGLQAIAVDQAGDSIVAGQVTAATTIGTTGVTPTGDGDALLAKFGP